eukprot:CAMPEP_0179630126 /NCGR_PEP_ID=MMETSP0932-20121108/5739_1 /TAXON_ID=548131 ORGANISM="Ostreococcus mediterraneus, Strain clade-D-RCC2596" /NCGR_SAMPLE_ID=MMETSP0932 /ASSEMBLY_ACC=CAM_ASM_000582 /LENGTH=61 /DNA_ID=CAMNT_0021499581 /DNA_START=1324 /DNA_END=1512 /DNA_ORIENTATION=+
MECGEYEGRSKSTLAAANAAVSNERPAQHKLHAVVYSVVAPQLEFLKHEDGNSQPYPVGQM